MTLVPLSRREDAPLPDGTFDVRGWEVRTGLDDEKVGKVDDMLLDGDGSPRLLDVDLGLFKKHVLVPLRWARAEPSEQVVRVEGLDRDQLKEVPEYDPGDKGVLSADYETRLLTHYARIAGGAGPYASPDPRPSDGLARLGDLDDLRVAKASADPRGWTVVSGDGVDVGRVAELLVDTASMKGRYLDVDLDEEELGLERLDRHVLLPVARTRLDGRSEKVLVDGLFAEDFGAYPVYRGLPLEAGAHEEVEAAFGRPGEIGGAAGTDRFFGRPRRPDRGRRKERAEPAGTTVGPGEEARVRTEAGEVRIRVRGDDIVIERGPGGEA